MRIKFSDMVFSIFGIDLSDRKKRGKTIGAGTQRRIAREAEYRAEQEKRLSGAEPPKVSRQVRRRLAMGRI